LEPSTVDAMTGREALGVIRRRWWLLAFMVVLVPLSVYVFSTRQEHLHTATVHVYVSSEDYSSAVVGGQATGTKQDPVRNLDTLAGVAKNSTVAQDALGLARTPGITSKALLADTAVSADPTADISRLRTAIQTRLSV
jgi:hypothetical protein